MKNSILTCLLMLALSLNAVFAQHDHDAGSKTCVPHNAFAYVFMDAESISKSSDLAIPIDMLDGIKTELDRVFEKEMGIRPTQWQDVSVVLPEWQSTAQDPLASVVGLVAFKTAIDSEKIWSRFGADEWVKKKIEDRNLFVHKESGFSLFHHSDNVLAMGQSKPLQWFLENRGNREKTKLGACLSRAHSSPTNSCQLEFGFDGTAIPREHFQFVPPELEVFSQLEWASLRLDLDGGIRMTNSCKFSSEEGAQQFEDMIESKIAEGLELLKSWENPVVLRLNDDAIRFEDSIELLGTLSAYRYGQKLLSDVEIKSSGGEVVTRFGMRGNGTGLAVVSLTAIQAIGTNTGPQFQAVAEELAQEQRRNEEGFRAVVE